MALTGSSFATPVVSGVAALLMAEQLRHGDKADPLAAGRAILRTASDPPAPLLTTTSAADTWLANSTSRAPTK